MERYTDAMVQYSVTCNKKFLIFVLQVADWLQGEIPGESPLQHHYKLATPPKPSLPPIFNHLQYAKLEVRKTLAQG